LFFENKKKQDSIMSTNWIIGGVTVPNFFITRASFFFVEQSDMPCDTKNLFIAELNHYLETSGLMPIIRTRQIIYHRKHSTTTMIMKLHTNADDSFGWMRYEGRVPGDKKFFYLFDGQKHKTDDWGNPLYHVCNKKHSFIPYIISEWYIKQQQLYRNLEERHRMSTTGILCRISYDVFKNYVMPYLLEA